MFGAKKTRYLPVVDWESLVIAVSDDVWTVPSSFTKKYIERAEQKLKAVNYNTKLFVYPRDGGFEEVINKAITEASNRASL
jgi:CRISPR-associated protein Csa2